LGCVATVCGFNHRFGHRGLGDHTLLERFFGKDKAISLDEIKFFGETVSSSAIRRHLVDGKIDMANAMLGEITERAACAVSSSSAVRVLIPMNRTKCDNIIAGVPELTIGELLDSAAKEILNLLLNHQRQTQLYFWHISQHHPMSENCNYRPILQKSLQKD
jgi:hypothetical protein